MDLWSIALIVIIVSISGLFCFGIFYSIVLEPIESLNEKFECVNCKIVSRKGMIILNNMELNCHHILDADLRFSSDSTNVKCPHCQSARGYNKGEDKVSPLSPKFNMKLGKELLGSIDRNEYTKDVDTQMKSYLKIQQRNLDKMNKEVGEKRLC